MTQTLLSSSVELSADGMGKTVIDIPLSGSANVAYQTPWNSAWAFSTTYHPSGDNNTHQAYDNVKFTRVG